MPEPTRLLALNPVIPVRDMPAALAFYTEQLGFVLAFGDAGEQGGHVHYAGVRRDGLCLHLQTMGPDESPTMPLIRIQVSHIDTLYHEYAGQELVAPNAHLETKPWGSREFGLYDLNGAALVYYEDL